jgi:hypothetical protein
MMLKSSQTHTPPTNNVLLNFDSTHHVIGTLYVFLVEHFITPLDCAQDFLAQRVLIFLVFDDLFENW